MTMIEKVARAMRAEGFGWVEPQRSRLIRAMIAAMREPTEAMIDAADETPSIRENWGADALPVWEAMIDTALKETA